MKNELLISIKEDIIKDKIKNRSKFETSKLFIRRIITFAISIAILMIGWALIILVNINDNKI